MTSFDDLASFRAHRHDVLNQLQLVRAYVQLNRPEQALRSVDALAGWLTSIGHVQNTTQDPRLVWMVAKTPHVTFHGVSELHDVSEEEADKLHSIGEWLESECMIHGFQQDVTFVRSENILKVCIRKTEETAPWWDTIHKDVPFVSEDGDVRLMLE